VRSKGGRFVGLKTVPIVLMSGSLKLLEPSGPMQVLTKVTVPFVCDNYGFVEHEIKRLEWEA
jgi:hypothetical protein